LETSNTYERPKPSPEVADGKTAKSNNPNRRVVKQAYEEEGLEKAAVETAIWRLTQQGQIYQPEPGKIKKL